MSDVESNVRPERRALTCDSARYFFLKALAVIYLIAFVSFGTQVTGLIGQHGILPLATFLRRVSEALGGSAFRLLPTIFWINSSDFFLQFVCLLGAAAAVLVFLGKGWRIALIACYALYLSLVHAGQEFMSYQWDMLLLEAGFLAIFLAWHPIIDRLFRWLLFRLMLLSGLAKLMSGDPTWRNLSALRYHYETQPLPTPLAWYMHQLPPAFQRASVAVMFGIELIAPVFIFLPRRFRPGAALAIIFLQLMILLTGNYTFFNWLTMAFCLFLLDDDALRPLIPKRVAARIRPLPAFRFGRPIAAAAAALVLLLSSILLLSQVGGLTWRPATALVRWFGPFGIANNYGLFSVMTTSRDEIIVEGSDDGTQWKAYEFKYKPGDVYRMPPIVAPFQPRLDWQMWFAALGNYRDNAWLVNFCVRLLQGSRQAAGLLQKNPFPDAPPKYVRALVYRYWFTDFKTRRQTGAWWNRTPRGLYLPAISMDNVRAEGM